ncbi:uncharacterized protein [Dysidea avara]|uniref:uncharacterized protein n=1 Tax=Dysidea avara TaxID=196820 RepID=UPI00331984C6
MIQCTAFTTDIFDVNLVVFTWMGPEGITITNDSRVTIGPTSSNNSAYTSSLQFIYLMERDNGTYMCNVTILTVDGLASVLLEPLTIPTLIVNVTATKTQMVGQSLTLECSVTTVRGITSRVDIIWSSDGTELERMEGVSVSSTTDNSVVYTDTYNISQLNTTDDGREYQCEVVINTSPPVIANDSVTLDVMVPPPIVVILPSGPIQGAMVGNPQMMECRVSTASGVESSSVMISWMGPGGDTITNDSRVTISPTSSSGNNYTSSIHFTHLMEGDNGTYTCNVMILETNGSVLLVLGTLTMPTPNITFNTLSTQTVSQSLTLKCSVTTVRGITSRVDIIWSSDGTELERMEGVNISSTTGNSVVYTDTYYISQLNTTDDGREYQCEVVINTSPPVMANDSVTLDVMVPPPTVTISPSGPIQGAMVGNPQMMECRVSTVSGVESSSVMIMWMGPGGDTITNDSRVTISPTSSSGNNYSNSLQFTYLMEGDNGIYTCNVMIMEVNGSAPIKLETLAIPFPNLAATSPNTQMVGQLLTLKCSVTTVRGITSRVDIIWSSDGTELDRIEGGNVSSTTDNSVVYTDTYNISQLNTTDDGREYQCVVVINTSPPVMANDSVTLDVMVLPPIVVILPSDPIQGAMVGNPQIMECRVSTVSGVESSSVMIMWMGPGGDTITNDSRVTISPTSSSGNNYSSSIQFTYLMEGDNGTYTCNVTILEVNESASVVLESISVPTVTIVSTPAGTPVSGSTNTFDYPILSSVTLMCMVSSNNGSEFTVTSYQWNTTGCYTNPAHNSGNPACFPTGQTNQSVTDDNVTAEDGGTITCTATIGGNNYSSEPLTLFISGIALAEVDNETDTGNLLTDYSYINGTTNGLLARCVSGLGPTGTDDNTDLGIWYFNGTQLPYGLCQPPIVHLLQSHAANLTDDIGVINLWQCGAFTATAEGVYKCVMMDSSMMNQTRRLGVYFSGRTAPILDPQSSSALILAAGSPLTLSCTSRGSPPDTFTWRKDSGPIVQSTSITTVTHNSTSAVFRAYYSINSVSISDSGTYTCTVTNPIGSDSVTITVIIMEATPSYDLDVSTTMFMVMPTMEVTSRPPSGDNNLLGLEEWQGALIIIIASLLAIGFCIALGLMVGAIFRHTRRKPNKPPKRKLSSTDDNLEYVPLEMTASVPTSPTEMATIYPNTATPKTDPLTINQLHKTTKEIPKLHQEFESIPKLIITETVYVGIQDKNRVDGYLPTPDSRVLLSSSFPQSTYINANYVKGYEGAEKRYIATQAPLPNTINDFWLMVWEQKPALIVMIEEINETINYWPDVSDVVHQENGLITVTMRKRIVKPDYTITTFRLVHAAEEKYIDIGHYWYKKWGIYQLPHDATGVIAFLQEVGEAKKSLPGPIVVHCSDGLDRTGALIATDVARQQLENENQVDVIGIVTTMRKDRGGMISTKEQYAFVYQILSDWAKSLHVLEPFMDNEMAASTEHLVP